VELENQPLLLFLLRFYNIDEGEILVDKNIYDFDLENLRGNMSIVPQDVILWNHQRKHSIRKT
jgi:ABC-type multidrug transport system fused ATPase/permease subunit